MLGGKLRIPHEASTLRRHAESLASSLWITRVCLFGSLRWTCVRRRLTRGERKQFLGHARGSLYEVETQLLMARRVGYAPARRVRVGQRSKALSRRLLRI